MRDRVVCRGRKDGVKKLKKTQTNKYKKIRKAVGERKGGKKMPIPDKEFLTP